MTAHSELVARLEGASEGSRDLDRDLVDMLRPFRDIDEYRVGLNADPEMSWWVTGDTRVTTSLDAALALAERVLPGWYVGVQANRYELLIAPEDWSAYLSAPKRHDFEGEIEGSALTPALALCVAILRAQPQPDGEKT